MTRRPASMVAIDLGASTGRVMHGAWDGARLGVSEVHRFPNAPVRVEGHLHWNVLGIFDQIQRGLGALAAGHGGRIESLAVDTWGVDFALLDARGRLLGNPYHYRDGRTDGVMERLFERVPFARVYERTGIQRMQINTLVQLWSMAEHDDPQLRCAETLLFMPDLFHYWLSGRAANEYTIASTSQMLHASERKWDRELLDEIGLPADLLLDPTPPGSVLDLLRSDVAEACGLGEPPAVVATASHDTASAVAAIPGLDERSAYISSGTWSLMGVEARSPVTSEKAFNCQMTNEGGVGGTIRLLKNIAGLWLLQECRRQWRREGRDLDWEDLLAQAEASTPFLCFVDADAEAFLSPGNMPAALRAACRRTGQPEPETVGAVARCCLESLALTYRSVLDDLEALVGHRLDVVRIVGGGSRNRLLNQFTADACERPVVAGPVEATALGNLMVQAVTHGFVDSIAEGREAIVASVERTFYEPRDSDAWSEAYARFREVRS